MGKIKYAVIELGFVIGYVAACVVLHSLWPASLILLSLLVRSTLKDYYNYKHTDVKVVESIALQAELDSIRLSHIALEKSTNTVNEQLSSLKTALSMIGKR